MKLSIGSGEQLAEMIEEEVADREDRGESSPRSQVRKVAKEKSKALVILLKGMSHIHTVTLTPAYSAAYCSLILNRSLILLMRTSHQVKAFHPLTYQKFYKTLMDPQYSWVT